MIDATKPFEKQDLHIADLIAREGRAVVFAMNKWDLVTDKAGAISRFSEKRDRLLPQVVGAPLVAVSAKTGDGIERLQGAIIAADAAWNRRIGTSTLNRFLEDALQRHATPAVSGRRLRIKYLTQVKTRPPGFVVSCSRPDAMPASYLRYLVNGLRTDFDMPGTPIRMVLRAPDNPYAGRAAKR